MIPLRKALINASTNTEKVNQLIKELNRLIDDLNVALRDIDTQIRGNTSGNS
jgi:hypothetical protein